LRGLRRAWYFVADSSFRTSREGYKVAKKEKFGKFVLLEEVENVGIGREYRAAKLGSAGLEKIVSVLRLTPPLATHAEAVKSLMDQVKFAAQLQNPNVLKIYGIGKVDASYYISYEFLEGKSLRAIFSRCRQDGFPFSIDHALLIASKICSALEYAHQRKNEAGGRYYHGLVTPGSVLVSYEGEVRLRGFGYWPSRLREAGALPEDAPLYLAPEQMDGGQGDTKSDIFAVGAILFETLTGEPLFQGGRGVDPATRVSRAKVQSPTTDDDALPKPIADILQRSLAKDPAARYAEIQEVRKAVDTLLFSGDFTPTTFNLAFFMHSLFREDIERESKSLREEKDASYIEFLTETGPLPRAAATPVPGVPAETVMMPPPPVREVPPPAPPPRPPAHTPVPAAHTPLPLVPPPPREHPAHREPAHREPAHREPAHREPAHAQPPAHPPASSTDSGFTFHKADAKAGSKMPLIAGGIAAALLVGVGGWFAWTKMRTPAVPQAPPTTTLSAEAAAAVARVKELEDKLKAIEAEKAAAEAKAADDAKKKLEAQAAAKGQAVDPAALAKAQEEATKKARAEQEKKAQEERRRLEDEKKAEEARLAEERRKQEEEAARVAAATTTTLPAPTTTTAPPAPVIRAGSLVNLSDPGVIAPVAERVSPPLYPEIARRQNLEGTVELNVLVDERGAVADVQVVTGAGGKSGLNEAAVDNVRKRRYRPATKDGVPVKVWVPVRVQFKLPKN
jgi:TonB family protein